MNPKREVLLNLLQQSGHGDPWIVGSKLLDKTHDLGVELVGLVGASF